MNKITSILVDDEEHGRGVLHKLLEKFCPDIEICGEARNIKEAYNLINNCKPELVFLDVQMPGGSGFDLLRKFDKIDFSVVFVTSYDKYAVTAFRFSALDFLLKPVDIKELKECVEKVRAKMKEKNGTNLEVELLNNLDEKNPDKKLPIHHNDKVKLVNISDIISLEGENNYTAIHTSDGQKLTHARTLKDFEIFLEEHKFFLRISKSTIVNLDYVAEYSKGDPCFLTLKNGKKIEISRRKKAEMNERIK